MTIVITTGVMLLGPQVGRYIFRLPASQTRDASAFDGFKIVMSTTSVVLALAIIQANTTLHNVESVIAKEAAAITAVDSALLAIDVPEAASVRASLADYGSALVAVEWPGLAHGQRSAIVDANFGNLIKHVLALAPRDVRQEALYAALLRYIEGVATLREERLISAPDTLPVYFWVTVGGFMILAFALAVLTDRTRSRAVGIAGPTIVVALMLAFLVIVDLPFSGETSVSPMPIQKALIANANRT